MHWGGALRRMHPHHFKYRSHVADALGRAGAARGHCTLADWPLGYDELEPYYDLAERVAGVAGDRDANPFVPRSQPLPDAAAAPVPHGRAFPAAARELGLHAYPTPVA